MLVIIWSLKYLRMLCNWFNCKILIWGSIESPFSIISRYSSCLLRWGWSNIRDLFKLIWKEMMFWRRRVAGKFIRNGWILELRISTKCWVSQATILTSIELRRDQLKVLICILKTENNLSFCRLIKRYNWFRMHLLTEVEIWSIIHKIKLISQDILQILSVLKSEEMKIRWMIWRL